MPPVAAAIAAVATTFISTVGSVFLAIGFTAGTAGFIAGTILRIGIGLALGFVMRALSPKPPPGAINQGQEVALKFDPAYPREVVVGKAATGGSQVFACTSGSSNEYLWRVIALSDCEIEELSEIWAEGRVLTFSGDWHAGYVSCTSHYKSAGGSARMWARCYKGTDSQTVDTDLDSASADWNSNCRGRGIAYVIIKKQYDPDAFPAGEPPMFFVVKGAKILDPRTDTTVWTQNAALIAAKAIKGFFMNGIRVVGLGASDDDIPDDALEDAADICDEDVSLAAGGTEDRYRANGVISGAESAREIITNLTAAMGGRHIDRGGEIIFKPGAAQTAVMHITDADICADAPISYAQKRTADQLTNTLVSTFVSPDAAWQETPLPVRKDATAITEDGDRLVARRAYRYVTSKTQGERLDSIALKEARQQARAAIVLPIWALELEPGDWITWASSRFTGTKTFVVEGMQLAISNDPANPVARVQLALAEVATSVYSWSTSDEITNAQSSVTRAAAPVTIIGVPTAITYSVPLTRSPNSILSSADVGSTATVTVAAHTDTGAGGTVSRNSGTVTGLSFATGYHIWANDPGTPYGAGGAVTYVASTAVSTYVANNDYKWLGYITTVADGGGGGSYTPPGAGDCVAADAWLDPLRQAKAIEPGSVIDVLNATGTGAMLAAVDGARIHAAACVRLVSTSGIALTCSRTTPITQRDGSVVLAPDALGAEVAVDDAAGFRWERIAAVDDAGERDVARIHVGGATYAAGDKPGERIYTHNPLK